MRSKCAYQRWFRLAAAYNALWGLFVIGWPNAYFHWFGMTEPQYPEIFQALGMVVGCYALGYWYVSLDPIRFGPFVYVGLLGKVLGPIGLVFAAVNGRLPWSFGLVNLTNDVLWLPVFISFVVWYRKQTKENGAEHQLPPPEETPANESTFGVGGG